MTLPPEFNRLRQATAIYLKAVEIAEVALRDTVTNDPEWDDWLFTVRDHLGSMRENMGGTPEGLRWLLEEHVPAS